MFQAVLRKTFLQLHFRNNTISGIGGPSAPHVFALDRVEDLGTHGMSWQ